MQEPLGVILTSIGVYRNRYTLYWGVCSSNCFSVELIMMYPTNKEVLFCSVGEIVYGLVK